MTEMDDFEIGQWVRVINTARGTFLCTGFVRELLPGGLTTVEIDLPTGGVEEWVYELDELEAFS